MNGSPAGSIDTGGVISKAFQVYVDQAPVLLPASAVVFVIEGLVGALLVALAPALFVVSLVLSLVATSLFTGMVVELVADLQDGRRDASVGQLLSAVTPVLGQLIIVGFAAAIGEGIGFVLIIVPGLFLITIWAVFAPVILIERVRGLAALGRSRELVRGNGWQVFGVIFVMFVLVAVIGGLLQVAGDAAGSGVGLVVRVVVGVLTSPLVALAQAVLYFELKRAHGEGSALVPPSGDLPSGEPPTSNMPSGIV